jgi:hypothetical protein
LEWRVDHGGGQVQEMRLLLYLALPAESAREQILGAYNDIIVFNYSSRILEWCMDHGGGKVQDIRLHLSLALPAESAREQNLG